MHKENGDSEEQQKLMLLLQVKEKGHDILVDKYQQKQKKLYAQLKGTMDIKERIKLQNVLLELDDAFLEYQSSIHRKRK